MADDTDTTEPGAAEAEPPPESLLPYDQWMEDALRRVVATALTHVATEGLPGEHHFFITFRTDAPGVTVPPRLRAQYPQEMTIVLQHQFWGLAVDPAAGTFTVGLSFGGVPATLLIPLAAVTGFADPYVRYGLRFRAAERPAPPPALPAPPSLAVVASEDDDEPPPDPTPQVVSLDAFRRRPPPRDGA